MYNNFFFLTFTLFDKGVKGGELVFYYFFAFVPKAFWR